MRAREIDSVAIVRFIRDYGGAPGKPFREALASHFKVSLRTVEAELPRHVELGHIEERVLPGRGAPKTYRLTPAGEELAREAHGFRKYADLVARGDMPKSRNYLLEHIESAGEFKELMRAAFYQGWWAVCMICGHAEFIVEVAPFTQDKWPVCPRHPTRWDEETQSEKPRPMLSAWTLGHVQLDDSEAAASQRGQITHYELVYRRLVQAKRAADEDLRLSSGD